MSDKIHFGMYDLDRDAMELRKHGVLIRLQEQPFRVLAILAGRPGEIVTREELQEQIWGKDTFVDFEQSLNKSVNRLREALNDDAGQPRYVPAARISFYRAGNRASSRGATLDASRFSLRRWASQSSPRWSPYHSDTDRRRACGYCNPRHHLGETAVGLQTDRNHTHRVRCLLLLHALARWQAARICVRRWQRRDPHLGATNSWGPGTPGHQRF
jgi:hypothetical protein